jgi:arginyl-tRNA synthetase
VAVVDEVKEKNPESDPVASEKIAIASLKYAILKAKAGMNINFDPETSLSFEGDSGPYLQYTAVRARSLLSKGVVPDILVSDTKVEVEGTQTLERVIARFPEIITRAQQEWSPHYLVTYLTELAQHFNSWYGQGKIIDDDKDKTTYRLLVTKAVERTLTKGLSLLGIEVPERM